MKKQRRIASLLSAGLCIAMLLSGCGSNQSSQSADTAATTSGGEQTGGTSAKTTGEDTFVYATNGEPGNLDPQENSYLMGQIITNCIYDTLVTRDAQTGEIFPALAESWEYIDDTTLRFTLRDDVQFQNGEPMTAEDVLYSLRRMESGSASSSYYTFIDGEASAVVDENTVDLKMHFPFSGALNYLSNPRGAIVCESYVEEVGDDGMAREPMGTGAFVFDEWISGDRVTCHRFEDYWGEKPAYTNLVVRFITDASTRFIELETGGVDACDNISGDNYTRMLNGVENCVLYDTLSTKTFYIVTNDEHDIVSDINVRRALAYALDREAIVEAAYGESAVVADSSVASTLPFYESQAEYYPYDPDKARECLKEAGYENGLDLELVLEEVTELQNLAEVCQAYWAEVGINVSIQVYDIATAGAMSNSGEAYFTIRNAGCASGDPDQCYNMFAAEYGGTNAILDPVFNEMIQEGRVEQDEEKRTEIYKEVQRYVAENMYEIPLLNPIFAYGTRDYVTNFDADPSNVPNLKVVTFEE